MKTFKIQPRCTVEGDCLQVHTSLRGRKELEGKPTTPTHEKGTQQIAETSIGIEFHTKVAKDSGKSGKFKNRSLIDASHAEPLARVRMVTSEWIGYLDNQIFRLKTEGESQHTQLVQTFEEMCTRLARKLKYWEAHIEQQVGYLSSTLIDHKEKLEHAILELDRMACRAETANMTSEELEAYLGISRMHCPQRAILPTLVDSQEMLSTFNELVEGHICRKEVGVDPKSWAAFSARLSPQFSGGLLLKKDDPSLASSSVMKVNTVVSLLSGNQIISPDSHIRNQDHHRSPLYPVMTHKHTNSEAQGEKSDKRITKMADQPKQNPKQKSYDANSHRTSNPPSQAQLKEISKLAGRLQMPNSQTLNTPVSQQHKAYFGQPFMNKAPAFFNTTLNLGSLRQQSSMTDGDAYGSVHELAGRHSTNWLRGRTNPTNSTNTKRVGSNVHQTNMATSDLHGIHQTGNTLNLSLLSHEQPSGTLPGSRAASVKRPASSVYESLRAHQIPISAQTVAEHSNEGKQGSSIDKHHLGLHNHFHKKFRHFSEPDELNFKEMHGHKTMLVNKDEASGLQQVNFVSGLLDTQNLKEQVSLTKHSFVQSPSEADVGSKWTSQPGRTPLKFEFSDRMVLNGPQKPTSENDSWVANQPNQTRQSSKSPGRDAGLRPQQAVLQEQKCSKAQGNLKEVLLDLECHENMEIILPRPITHIEEADDDCED